MDNLKKYEMFMQGIIDETPEYMKLKKYEEIYLLFDAFVMALSDKAMPWLFKVYLEQNLNVLENDNFTEIIKEKYKEYKLKILNKDGNVFLNKNSFYIILNELNLANQLIYDKKGNKFSLK